jgi:hypothetical protein
LFKSDYHVGKEKSKQSGWFVRKPDARMFLSLFSDIKLAQQGIDEKNGWKLTRLSATISPVSRFWAL